MERGATPLNTAMFGFRREWTRDGLRIPRVTGFTKIHGDGLGLTMLPGVSLHFTTADGLASAVIGDGRRVRITAAGAEAGMLLRWFPGTAVGAGELALASVLAGASDGARWAGVNRSVPGITRGGVISET